MKIKSVVAAAIIMAFAISNKYAQVSPGAPTSNQRNKKGIKRGELTKAEAATLRTDRKDLKNEFKEARKDENVTRNERRKIRHDKKHLNRKFSHKKHDKRDRH